MTRKTLVRRVVVSAFTAAFSAAGLTLGPVGPFIAEASNGCFSLYTSGGGAAAVNVCISNHGNVVKFESPAGFEQIGQLNTFRDGYAICTGNLPTVPNVSHGYDTGGIEAGFTAPTISQPNGPNTFPLTISRDTTDGVFQLQQSYKLDKIERDLTITMKVVNLSAVDQDFVKLSRYFEGDVDNNASAGRFGANDEAVWEWVNTTTGHGLMLSNLTPGFNASTTVHTVADHNPLGSGFRTGDGCIVFAGQVATPTDPATVSGANLVGRVIYGMGTIHAGNSKIVKVLYRRF